MLLLSCALVGLQMIERSYYVFGLLAVIVSLLIGRFPSAIDVIICRPANIVCSKHLQICPTSKDHSRQVLRTKTAPDFAYRFPDDVVDLAMELVSIPSPSGAEHAAGMYIAEWLSKRGWKVIRSSLDANDPNSRFNILALPTAAYGASDVRIILSTHFDTVPVSDAQPRFSNSRLYGRGSTDAKGILASMLVAAQKIQITRQSPLGLLFVSGEETDHAGMMAANQYGFSENVTIVNGEPTTGRICVKQKGMLKVRLDATGIASHSGYPELGSSAIDSLLDAIAQLKAVAWPQDSHTGSTTTLNVGLISGGSAANVVPAQASATVMFRLVSDAASVIDTVQRVISSVPNVTVTPITHNDPLYMFTPLKAADAFGTYVAKYNTDLSYFRTVGKKVLFGGGNIINAHIRDEYIDLEDLERMPEQYAQIVEELLDG